MSTRGRLSCDCGNHLDVDDLVPRGSQHGLRAEQIEDLRLEDALVPHRLIAPDHERDLLGILAVLLHVIGKHLVGELHAHVP